MRLGSGRVHRVRLILALGAALAVAPSAAGCGGDEPSEDERGQPDALTVEARDFAFVPAQVEVAVGDEVIWENVGEQIHNVRGRGFFSDAIAAGDSYRRRFAEPGRYRYVCTLHPATMRGVVSVARR